MKFNIIPDQDALSECAWCGGRISDDMEVAAIDCRFATALDMAAYESHCVQLGLASKDKYVNMMVTAQGSEAKQHGKDGMFLLCSQDCSRKLKHAIEEDPEMGRLLIDIR